jgi:hypothetical protein
VTVRHLHTASLTRDPGHLPDFAWLDLERHECWDRVDGGDYEGTSLPNPDGLPAIGVGPEDFLPTRDDDSGAVPGHAARVVDLSPDAPATPPAGASNPF